MQHLIENLIKRDLSDTEWEVLKPLLPSPKGFGHPRKVDLREILNGIFYVQRTGCQWEMLPHDLPPHTTVYGYFHALVTERNMAANSRSFTVTDKERSRQRNKFHSSDRRLSIRQDNEKN